MTTRLWEYDEDGEPWLENTPLLIVNRKRKAHKKGKKRMARYTRRRRRTNRRVHRRGRKANTRRRVSRRRRRNPWPMAGTVVSANPRRRHRRGRKNAHRRRHRRGRRNAALLGISLPPLQSVLFAGVGFVGTPMVEGFLQGVLPVSLTATTLGKYATRIASVLGLSFLTKMILGRSQATMVGIGGGAYVLTTAVREFMPQLLPASMGAYAAGTQWIPSGMGMRSYTGGTEATFHPIGRRSLGAPNWGAQNTVSSAPFGGSRIVAQRFRRFN